MNRTYAGTLYIAYRQNEIVNTIISFFRINITFNIYSKGYKMLNLFAKNLELLDNNDMIILVPKKNMNFNYVVTSQYLLKS